MEARRKRVFLATALGALLIAGGMAVGTPAFANTGLEEEASVQVWQIDRVDQLKNLVGMQSSAEIGAIMNSGDPAEVLIDSEYRGSALCDEHGPHPFALSMVGPGCSTGSTKVSVTLAARFTSEAMSPVCRISRRAGMISDLERPNPELH